MATFDLLAAQFARALRPLAYGMDSQDGVRNVVESLGWELPAVPTSLTALGQDLVQLNSSLADLSVALQRDDAGEAADNEVDDALENLTLNLVPVVADFKTLPDHLRAELPADFVSATHIDQELTGRMFDWLISFDLAKN